MAKRDYANIDLNVRYRGAIMEFNLKEYILLHVDWEIVV